MRTNHLRSAMSAFLSAVDFDIRSAMKETFTRFEAKTALAIREVRDEGRQDRQRLETEIQLAEERGEVARQETENRMNENLERVRLATIQSIEQTAQKLKDRIRALDDDMMNKILGVAVAKAEIRQTKEFNEKMKVHEEANDASFAEVRAAAAAFKAEVEANEAKQTEEFNRKMEEHEAANEATFTEIREAAAAFKEEVEANESKQTDEFNQKMEEHEAANEATFTELREAAAAFKEEVAEGEKKQTEEMTQRIEEEAEKSSNAIAATNWELNNWRTESQVAQQKMEENFQDKMQNLEQKTSEELEKVREEGKEQKDETEKLIKDLDGVMAEQLKELKTELKNDFDLHREYTDNTRKTMEYETDEKIKAATVSLQEEMAHNKEENETQLGTLREDMNTLKEEVAAGSEEQGKTLQAKISQQAEKIAELADKAGKLTGELEFLKASRSLNSNIFSQLEQNKGEAGEVNEANASRLAAVEEKLKAVDEMFVSTVEKFEALAQQKVDDKGEEQDAKVAQLREDVDALRAEVDEKQKGQEGALQSKIQDQETQHAEMIAELRSDLNRVEEQYKTATGELSKTAEESRKAEAGLLEQLKELRERLSQQEGQLRDLAKANENAETRYVPKEALGAFETRLGDQEAQNIDQTQQIQMQRDIIEKAINAIQQRMNEKKSKGGDSGGSSSSASLGDVKERLDDLLLMSEWRGLAERGFDFEDRDNSGEISKGELSKTMEKLQAVGRSGIIADLFPGEDARSVDTKSVQEVIASFSKDGDASLSKGEFVLFATEYIRKTVMKIATRLAGAGKDLQPAVDGLIAAKKKLQG
uniref:Uncharacterized protein n=1 Tax=Chromera velia CCMP2878 TaxID=1169474 RepID=A0A0G4F9A7_9ALVE|eukprot:Cvel_15866.t1-p1 / transcript=Cvel_15866.t1 / gene=Cvel_15866 / organism=Chromera_velia_CCMP2878 / gene_product=Restin homolog, putative / transcript_product=Restin homolog, putative / location=Cvel_scaffold1196:27980-44691(+) / protein_length=819 / sequence_SO=supercontig / SO=protein_coding / is_pseudo=false